VETAEPQASANYHFIGSARTLLSLGHCDPINPLDAIVAFDHDLDNFASSELAIHDTLCPTGFADSTTCTTTNKWTLDGETSRPISIALSAYKSAVQVTLPSVFFYRWLYGADGKLTRSMHAKLVVLKGVTSNLVRVVAKAQRVVDEANGVLADIKNPMEKLSGVVTQGTKVMGGLSKVLFIGVRDSSLLFFLVILTHSFCADQTALRQDCGQANEVYLGSRQHVGEEGQVRAPVWCEAV
jgi:hypothetical protein